VNAKEVADELGTDAKTFRRFVRSPKSSFAAVGSGGRYEFDRKDLPTLRKKFNEWRQSPSSGAKLEPKPRVKVDKFVDRDDPMPVSMLRRRMTKTERERRDAASRARVERLEAALIASGKHISQYNNWGEKVDA
jgi:hypothetical protein